ncbi:tectonin domain-containing protein [Thalassospira povalilytica]|uniref:tectonin domain-containing protein n=1 Tax=Thalassospira povalilytica TaxID=732237 RepID=UPI003AA9033B
MRKVMLALLGCYAIVFGFFVPTASSAQETPTLPWMSLPGSVADIAINGDGQAYAVGLDHAVWRWDLVEGRWRPMSGKMKRIAAAEGNRPWAVSEDGAVFRYNGLWWEERADNVVDVAADTNGNVYIVKGDGSLFKWYDLRSEWRPIPGKAVRISVDYDAILWAVAPNGQVQAFDGKNWQLWNGRARDIAAAGRGQVIVATPEGDIRRLSDEQKGWVKIAGITDVATLAAAPDGGIWAVQSGGRLYTNKALSTADEEAAKQKAKAISAPSIGAQGISSEVPAAAVAVSVPITAPSIMPSNTAAKDTSPTVDRGGVIDPATITTKDPITFFDTNKTADQIAIGKDGSIFALDENGNVLRWSNRRRDFESFPGSLVRIAVDPEGLPWGISNLGRVFFNTGVKWEQVRDATASNIAIGSDGTVVIADASGTLFMFDENSKRFKRIQGAAIDVAVSPEGGVWGINADGFVLRCETSPCKVLPQKATDISIGPDGRVWVVSDQKRLRRLQEDGSTFDMVATLGQELRDVASGPNGLPWFVSTNGKVFASSYFERDESEDRLIAARSSGDTVGTGASESPVSDSPSAITFSKNMRFDTLDNGDLASGETWLEAGNDELIYAYGIQDRNFSTYDERRRKFVFKSTTLGSNSNQIDGFVADSAGAIWADVDSSGQSSNLQGLYRDFDGALRKYDDPCDTIEDLGIAPDDTLYIVCSFASGNNKLYRKPANSTTFRQIQSTVSIEKVAVGRAQDIWVIDFDGEVRQWDGRDFVKRPLTGQRARAISVGADGSIYIRINDDLAKWNSANQSFDKINNIEVDYLAVDQTGRPWISEGVDPVIKRAR